MDCPINCYVLSAEGKGIIAHGIHNCQGLHTDAFFSQRVAAVLKALFDDNTGSFQSCAGCIHYFDQTLECASVSQEIVNDQYMVFRLQEFF